MLQLAEDLWLLRFPLKLVGCDLGRNVSVIRLSTGKLVIHSTAAFAAGDIAAISALGEPGWLVEATRFHDTLAEEGRAAFLNLPYLAPPDMPGAPQALPLIPAPPEWTDELDVIPLEGMPGVREHVFHHRASATLLVADLLFNLDPGPWTRAFMRIAAGIKRYPAMSRLFRLCIKDPDAFRASLDRVRALPFRRIVVGHGSPIEENVRESFDSALGAHGY